MKEGFGELYTRLYNENKTELEELRLKSKEETNKMLFGVLFFFIGIIIVSLTGIGVVIIVPLVILSMFMFIFSAAKRGAAKDSPTYLYKNMFKEKIIVPLITNVFKGAVYRPDKGWTREQYREGGYKEIIDRYSSEDLITSPIELKSGVNSTIEFCEVHTERESRDKDGHTSYTTIFHGIASKMKIDKDLGTEIYIKRNWSSLSGSKIKLDSPEFEKKFDVESKDRIMAVRVLTADVMAEMVDMIKKYGYSFEIHIIRDTIYMRVFTGEVFEPNIFKDSMEYQTLEKYYNVIRAMMNLSTHIYKVIDEIIM
ncbi:MAG: DUF3137 domain-containing protein [Clostridia bacterium]|nr:DUF3137 domain-containing protein [Clostridia bacterium]